MTIPHLINSSKMEEFTRMAMLGLLASGERNPEEIAKKAYETAYATMKKLHESIPFAVSPAIP